MEVFTHKQLITVDIQDKIMACHYGLCQEEVHEIYTLITSKEKVFQNLSNKDGISKTNYASPQPSKVLEIFGCYEAAPN